MSTHENRTPDPAGTPPRPPATPRIDALLARLGSRVTSQVVLHGLGTALAAAAAWLLVAFVLDAWLHLPGPIRVFHLALLLGIPAFFVWRELVRPLRRRPDRAGLAVLVERAHPELGEVLVSAVQLSESARPSGDPALVAEVVRAAEARAAGLSLAGVLDARGPRRRAWAAVASVGVTGAALAWNPDAARTFFARLAGANVPWPQRTHLVVEVPTSSLTGDAPTTVAGRDADLHVKVARGSDVPVVVRAEGDVPDEVVLQFGDGHKAVLAAGAGREFRTILRSLQADTSFHATGGDDQDERPRVHVQVLQPPDVSGLALVITPPAYSGLPSRVEYDRDVEVLAGTTIRVFARTDPPDATGRARLLPEDRVVPLEPTTWPTPTPEAAAGSEATNAPNGGPALGFAITAQKSLRFRLELTDSTGLANPDPGLFGVTVVEDRAPEVEVLAPGRGEFDTVAGGAVPLRARAEDDFGVATLAYTIEAVGAAPDSPRATPTELPFVPVAVDARREAEPSRNLRARVARSAVFGRTRLEVAALAPDETAVEGRQFQIQITATDVAAPEPRVGRAAPVRVRVVSSDEFLRRLQDRLARAQTSASALAELVRDKNRRTADLLAVLESDDPEGVTGELAAALTGQRRVLGDARALSRELCGGAESVLYARLDERAGAALDQIDAALSQAATRAFDAAPWRELAAASRDRQIAGTGLAGKLVDIAGLALEISEDLAAAATEELAAASAASDVPAVHERLAKASAIQKKTLERIDLLLERLAEYDNFQSVLTLTRDILNAQRGIRERTRDAARETK